MNKFCILFAAVNHNEHDNTKQWSKKLKKQNNSNAKIRILTNPALRKLAAQVSLKNSKSGASKISVPY